MNRFEDLLGIGNGEHMFPSMKYQEGRALAAVSPELLDQIHNYNWPMPYQWGNRGSGPNQFKGPSDIAISSGGDIVVCDMYNFRIQVCRLDGTFVRQWGSRGKAPGQFKLPTSVAVSSIDEVFVTDSDNHRIQVFHLDGSFVRSWGSVGAFPTNQEAVVPGQFRSPSGVAVHGDLVLVSDTNNHCIQCFRLDGTFVRLWPRISGDISEPGQFYDPLGLAVSAAGEVFVCDHGNHRVQVFDLDGTFVRQWGSQGDAPGLFRYPSGVAVSSAGEVLISDTTRVQVFLTDGTFVRYIHLPAGDQGAFGPADVAVTPSGDVVVSDSTNDRIYVQPAGA